jgi:lysyl oxidase
MPRRPDRAKALAVLLLVAAPLGSGCDRGGDTMEPPPTTGLTPATVDLQIVAERTRTSIVFEDHDFAPTDCAVVEGWVAAPGARRLLRFDSLVANMGELELRMGDPTAPQPPFTPADWELSACYGGYLFEDFAAFELRDLGGMPVGTGHKQACCIADSLPVRALPSRGYDCNFQGISPGWADLYPAGLDGQWVDVTGVPEGDYLLVITANPNGTIPEAHDVYSNTATISVHVPDPAVPL